MHSRIGAALLALACCTVLATACSHGSSGTHVSIVVSPGSALLDVPVSGSVHGLAAGQTVLIRASATDASHVTWTSSASFKVPADGVLSLAQQPVSGSYHGSDPMGLLLSMTPGRSVGDTEFVTPPGGYPVRFDATVNGRTIASTTIERRDPLTHDVDERPLRPGDGGLYGEMMAPTGQTGQRPAVLVLGGSGCGEPIFEASLIAAAGYPALALAYCGEPGLPAQLQNVPLEYVRTALDFLRNEPGVDPAHVLIYGGSRGGELALLVAATYPNQVNGVIAAAPSSRVNGSYPGRGYAWTLHGRPVPFGPIPVERIQSSILLSCGTLDLVWPACQYVHQIKARLTANHFGYPVTTARFPGAGHLASQLVCCVSTDDSAAGGTATANALAQVTGIGVLLRYLGQQ